MLIATNTRVFSTTWLFSNILRLLCASVVRKSSPPHVHKTPMRNYRLWKFHLSVSLPLFPLARRPALLSVETLANNIIKHYIACARPDHQRDTAALDALSNCMRSPIKRMMHHLFTFVRLIFNHDASLVINARSRSPGNALSNPLAFLYALLSLKAITEYFERNAEKLIFYCYILPWKIDIFTVNWKIWLRASVTASTNHVPAIVEFTRNAFVHAHFIAKNG